MKYFTPGGVSGKQGFVPWYSGKWIPRDETLYFLAKVYTPWQKLEPRDESGVDIMQKINLCMQNIMVPVSGSMVY